MTVNTDPLHRIFRSVIAELINCESDSRVVSKALILATKDALRVEIQTLVERILKVNDEQTRESQRWITESINFDDPHRVDSQHELDDVRAELVGKVKHLAALGKAKISDKLLCQDRPRVQARHSTARLEDRDIRLVLISR